jgi:hypothetical protein
MTAMVVELCCPAVGLAARGSAAAGSVEAVPSVSETSASFENSFDLELVKDADHNIIVRCKRG